MTQTMKQIRFSRYGSPEVLELVDTPIPQPNAGEVIVKVGAIGVNYSDILRRKNTYFQPTPLPYVLGSEAVETIVQTGEGVAEPYLVGATVLAILPSGGYAEYAVANAQYCVPLPQDMEVNAATAIFVQGSAAQLMISHLAGDLQNKTVLIHAAAGGVGSILVQLAKLNGAKVIAASSSDEKLQSASLNGADAGVNYTKPGWPEKVIEANNGKGVDIIFEMVGGDIYTESLTCLADGGHIIVYGAASALQGSMHSEYFIDHNISQSGFNLAFYITTKTQLWQQALGTVIALIAQGKLKIETPNRFALKDAAEAHRQIEARQTTGKVVLYP